MKPEAYTTHKCTAHIIAGAKERHDCGIKNPHQVHKCNISGCLYTWTGGTP